MQDLTGKVALVTGASRGLGVHIVRSLARRGMKLSLAARSEAGLEAVRAELAALGAEVITVAVDLSDPTAVERLVRTTEERLGPVHLLVNNAGLEVTGFYESLLPEQLQEIVATNLTAPMLLTRRVLPSMLERDAGCIINISSLAGLAPMPFGESYCATKHALVGFTRALRTSLEARGSNVHTSVVCPGFVAESGMFAATTEAFDVQAPAMLGACQPEAVALGVMRAIDRNAPELIVASRPVRPMLVLGAMFPRLAIWFTRVAGVSAMMLQVARLKLARQS